MKEVLACIEAGKLLPPLLVLQTLAKNPNLKLSVVKGYISRHLASENARIEEDRRAIAKYEAETTSMRSELQDLRTKVRAQVSSSPPLPTPHPPRFLLLLLAFSCRPLRQQRQRWQALFGVSLTMIEFSPSSPSCSPLPVPQDYLTPCRASFPLSQFPHPNPHPQILPCKLKLRDLRNISQNFSH